MSAAPEPVDFVTERLADGTKVVRLSRLTDGRVMCCLCFSYTARDDLSRDANGDLTDVCKSCRADEIEVMRRRAAGL